MRLSKGNSAAIYLADGAMCCIRILLGLIQHLLGVVHDAAPAAGKFTHDGTGDRLTLPEVMLSRLL
jgi:hypothetical protein